MIGIDSNVLLRYFLQDDAAQSKIASHVIERRLTRSRPGYITVVTTAEVVWTLSSRYHFSAAALAQVIEILLGDKKLVLQNEREIFLAMRALLDGHGFADALIAELCVTAGCSKTLTFDRKASRFPGFELL